MTLSVVSLPRSHSLAHAHLPKNGVPARRRAGVQRPRRRFHRNRSKSTVSCYKATKRLDDDPFLVKVSERNIARTYCQIRLLECLEVENIKNMPVLSFNVTLLGDR